MAIPSSATTYVYVGTYTRNAGNPSGNAEGIYVYRLDDRGTLSHVQTVADVVNPSYLAVHPTRRFLYAVNETKQWDGQIGGAISAFAIDTTTRHLTLLNRQLTHGVDPCFVSVDETGRYAFVANYGTGSVAAFPIAGDGRLGEASSFIQHEGSSVNPQRQQGPHAHSINPAPGNRYVLSCDLGLDQVLIYRLDLGTGKLLPNEPALGVAHAGAGPRHFAFHPDGRHVYVINELDSTLSVFDYDPVKGSLREIQSASTLPGGFSGRSHCADIHIAPSGQYVYGSNRGHDSIAVFSITAGSGLVTPLGQVPTGGRTPRNFGIDPTGTWLLAANQSTDTIVTFRLDPNTGMPTPTGTIAQVPTPVCLRYLTT